MDVVSHWLWGAALTRGKVKARYSGMMGVLPDLCAFVPSSIYIFATGGERVKVTDETVTSDFPEIAWQMYQISHSAIWMGLSFLFCWAWFHYRGLPKWMDSVFIEKGDARSCAWLLWLPWLAHIAVDIPSHAIQFFPTPFLMPISDWMFDGIRWSTPAVFFTNIALLIITWSLLLYREKNQKSMSDH